jgi:hypothetical protein
MPHTNKTSAPLGVDIPEMQGRYVDLDGYRVGFETYKAEVDLGANLAAAAGA